MATSQTSTGKTAKKATDAIAILTADHAKVKKLFKEFDRLHQSESDDEAEVVAKQICNELTVHATVEEDIFYPEVRAAIDDEDLLDEAEVEHASAKDLIAQIESMSASDDKFAAKVIVLGEYIDHHVKEEQEEMFPKAKKAKVDMNELGTRILARQKELKAELGMDDQDDAK
jgi:hemerythrin superfamily protein